MASVILWSFRADSERGFSTSARKSGARVKYVAAADSAKQTRLAPTLLSVGLNAALQSVALTLCVFKSALTGLRAASGRDLRTVGRGQVFHHFRLLGSLCSWSLCC